MRPQLAKPSASLALVPAGSILDGVPPAAKSRAPMKAFEEQTRRNIEMFQNAMRMFTPFPPGAPAPSGNAAAANDAAKREPSDKAEELQQLKDQIAAMQRKIDSMG